MRQFRLRTIMGLIVIIAVSMWVGMLIERSRQPPRPTFTTYRPMARLKGFVTPKSPSRPAPAVSGI
jgi:hypothetical protein